MAVIYSDDERNLIAAAKRLIGNSIAAEIEVEKLEMQLQDAIELGQFYPETLAKRGLRAFIERKIGTTSHE